MGSKAPHVSLATTAHTAGSAPLDDPALASIVDHIAEAHPYLIRERIRQAVQTSLRDSCRERSSDSILLYTFRLLGITATDSCKRHG